MINQDTIQLILRRLAEFDAKGVSDVAGERFLDLAPKEIAFQHLLYMKSERLIDAEEIRTGRMNQNVQRVYAIRLTNAGYQALQPELKARADDQPRLRNNPWLSGSFYLFVVIVVGVFILIAVNVIRSWLVLPLVVVGALIALLLIGVFQLRNDDRLSEKSFLELVGLTLKQLPLIRIPKKSGGEHQE